MADDNPKTLTPGQLAPSSFFPGMSQMALLMRSTDWSKTPFGPPEQWPEGLQSAVRFCLASRFPLVIFWTEELLQLYNDAFLGILGNKHPASFTQSAKVCWAEMWEGIAPLYDHVFTTGTATWTEDIHLPAHRHGYLEESFYTMSYTPITLEDGRVGGVLNVIIETTPQVIAERRTRTLRDLATRTASAQSVIEACRVSMEVLGKSADISFAGIYLLEADRLTLASDTGVAANDRVAPPSLKSGEDGPWPISKALTTHQPQVVTDIVERFGHLPGGPWGRSTEAGLVLPLHRPGQERAYGVLIVGATPQRALDDDFIGFFNMIAGQVTTAIANIRAAEDERRRAEALSEIDRAKTAFFSNVSHEFRTPLTLMLSPLEDLLATADGRSDDDRERLALIHRNGQRLLKLVNTLLDFSRIEAGRVQAVYEPVDLAAYTTDLVSVFRSAVEKAGIRLHVDCPPLAQPVLVDRDMWEKIVLNLVSNAYKYTFQGDISVSLRADDQHAVLAVKDTGTGIPPDALPKLFDRFYRVEGARGRTHEGTGIGLALVHELVKLHRGSVKVESVLGEGSTFYVRIPLGQAHLPAERIGATRTLAPTAIGAASFVEEAMRWSSDGDSEHQPDALLGRESATGPVASPRGRRSAKVLLADDNRDMREYVRRLLLPFYEVIAVADGHQALDVVASQRPDIIVTDVMMPKLDGFGLLKAVRADPTTAAIPVVMLSARAGEEARIEGLQAGADDYLTKPFSAKELLARVEATLELARVRRDAEERISRTLESITDALVTLDKDWTYTYVNAAAESLLGIPRAQLLGRRVWDVFPEIIGTDVEARLRRAATEKTAIEFEGYNAVRDCWYNNKLFPGPDDSLAIYFTDITVRKHAEQALREADRRKDEFLATLAHELRNPLAPISTSLHILQRAKHDWETVERARGIMERQLKQMVRLVDDLLDVSRVSRGKIELRKERANLADVIHNAVETSRPLIEQSQHELMLSVPPEPVYVEADVTRLSQVVSNLLNNAAKYTERRGRIWLSVARQGNEAVVQVADTGVGIAPEAMPYVFDMFTRIPQSVDGAQGGLGIGLSIVKRLVEMHGGTVQVRSPGLGKGSVFTVRMPLLMAPAASPAMVDDRPDETHNGEYRRVLVADDNIDAAESLAMVLGMLGHEVRVAHDGAEAVKLAAEFRPHLALLDIGMPRVDGYEACERMRSQPMSNGMTIVAVTGWGQEADRLKSKRAGFDSHLVKPVAPEALMELLRTSSRRSYSARGE